MIFKERFSGISVAEGNAIDWAMKEAGVPRQLEFILTWMLELGDVISCSLGCVYWI